MFLLLSVSVAFGQTAGGVLFNDVGVSAAGLDSNSGPEVVRERRVIINFGALSAPLPGASVDSGLEADSDLASGGSDLQGEPLQLNIFSDVALPVVFERTEGNSSGSRTWYGAVQNVPDSSVILVTNGGVMVGNIVVGTAIYQVRYLDGGVHVVREIDQSAFPPEGEPAQVDNPPDPHDDVTHLDSSPEGDTVVMDGRTTDKVIDVLVAYTTAAKNGEGGTLAMQNIIDLAIAESNIGYANSGITQRLNLVHTVEVSYTESGYLEQDRHRLQQPADGYMDNIHTLRNIYKADVVTLIVNNGDWCGMAYIMETVALSFEEYAFNVVRRTCAVGSYVFAHEIGHIMGARHDWYVDDSANQPYSYNHAYFNTTEKKRSIMAYNNGCDAVGGCTRLNYWSNPDRGPVSPWGVREGTSTSCTTGVPNPDCDADNRKTLNNTGFVVANFRVRDATATPSREFSSGAAPDIVADGVMFDLKAKETTTIHGFSSAFSSAGTVSRIEIYYRAGSYNLFDSFPSAWKLVGSVNDVEVQAAPAETHIPIDLDITIPAGPALVM